MRLVIMSKVAKVSRCTNNTGIPVIRLSKRSYRRALMIMTIGIREFKFNLHFKPIERSGYYKNKSFSFKYRCFSYVNSLNSDCKRCQHKRMTPNKFDDFLRSVQSMLKFVNGGYLHDNQQFCLIKYRIAQILLKINQLNGVIARFFQYSNQNNHTIGTTV